MFKKLNIRIIAMIGGGIVVIVIILLLFFTVRGKSKEVDELQEQVDDLSWQIDVYGDVVEVYTVIASKKSGEVFDKSDVDTMVLPTSQISDQFVTNLEDLKNCIYKIDVEPGVPLTQGLFFREVLTQTDRYADIVADLFPVGARAGDYYDLRVVTPNGLDYIVLSKKRAVDFYGSAVRFILTEEEIHQYQSALVDTFINPGTYLYMSTYVEPAMQKKATIYYPVSDIVRAVMEIDPNIVQIAESDLIARRRAAFEKGLEIDEERNTAIVAGRSEQVSRLVEAANEYLNSHAVVDEPSDGSESSDETGLVDSTTGNLMSQSGLSSEDSNDSTSSGTSTSGKTSAEQKTEDMMSFNHSVEIVPSDLENEIDKTGRGW